MQPWASWRPATCMPGRCFCEAIRDGWVRQPANTVSSLAYVVVAMWLLWRVRGSAQKTVPYMIAASLMVIGLGSAFYHASLTFAGQFFDVFGMYLLGTLVLVNALAKRQRWSPSLTVGAYLVLNLGLAVLLIAAPVLRRWLFAAVIVPAVWLELTSASERRRELVRAAVVLGLAFGVWVLDLTKVWCSESSFIQGHGVWHFGGALASLFYIKYIIGHEPRTATAAHRTAKPTATID